MLVAMRYLGIDFGAKRVGLALSDEGGQMAFPHKVVPNDGTLLATIVAEIEERGVGKVVIGRSTNRAGEDNAIQAAINAFITDLTLKVPVPIELEPEFYSTQEAIRTQGRTPLTDAAAATVILNSYLAKQQ